MLVGSRRRRGLRCGYAVLVSLRYLCNFRKCIMASVLFLPLPLHSTAVAAKARARRDHQTYLRMYRRDDMVVG